MSAARIGRGDVWLADLNPIRGREQAGTRPVVIVSAPFIQLGGLVVVVPFTTRLRGLQLHVLVEPPEGGLRLRSEATPEMERSISLDRLLERWGKISIETMIQIEERLRLVLALD